MLHVQPMSYALGLYGWLVFTEIPAARPLKPSTFPTSTCIDLLRVIWYAICTAAVCLKYSRQAGAHIDIKGAWAPALFLPREKGPFFLGSFFILLYFYKLIYVYMSVCVCVFLFEHSLPCQTNKKSKYQVGSGNEKLCRVPMPFPPPHLGAGARSTAVVAHIDRHMHITGHTEVKPSLPLQLCFVLVWSWVVKRLSYLCLEL